MLGQPLMLLLVVSLPSLSRGFQPTFGRSVTHRDITESAILRKTAEVCRDVAAASGSAFTLTIDDSLTVNDVQKACSTNPGPTPTTGPFLLPDDFQSALNTIHRSNARVDFAFIFSAAHHFDNEAFLEGRNLITTGLASVKLSVKEGNFLAGREVLGAICHTLQDFYSHSDWVELGKRSPYSRLIRRDQPLENLAGVNVPTCRNCNGDDCTNNILPGVITQQLITSGYFEVFSGAKPPGKCSHGGFFDRTSLRDPVGGINKDSRGSNHGFLHQQAADLAVAATLELLEDIRIVVGDRDFLRFMGLSQSSALCFVIDTTGSMRDDIAAVKDTTFRIIDGRIGTAEEPSLYILVPFNDPGFGPLLRTTDPDEFKASINSLTASGGGDNAELSLSGLQLALTAAPTGSNIFVFTDAPAKDFNLRNIVLALIERTQSVVIFLLTDVLGSRRRSLQSDGQNPSSRVLSQAQTELYRDIARASGGQTIEVSKLDLSQANAVIEDLSLSAVVTVFQAAVDPGRPEDFSFVVDASIRNVIIYITGAPSLTFRLTSSTGESQNSTEPSGSLANVTAVGNLRRVRLNATNASGLWEISINSSSAYTVRVTGQSSVNFVFSLVEERAGAHGGLNDVDGRPPTGGNVSLLVTVTGSDTATVTNVTLLDRSGSSALSGSVEPLGRSNFLVRFVAVPGGEFGVGLMGEDSSSTSRAAADPFQRQASTQIQTSSLSVTALAPSSNVQPGSNLSVLFTVSSNASGTFSLQANSDRSYPLTAPSSLTIASGGGGGEANGTVTIAVPDDATSGTDLTLTIQAQNAAATDINFAVLRFSVVATATDTISPVCQIVSTSGTCPAAPALCASTQWDVVANFTDGTNGTGITSVSLRQGNGSLSTTVAVGAGGENVSVITYNSSCCSQSVVVAAVDGAGNVGRCLGQARTVATPAPDTTPNTTTASDMSTGPTTASDMSTGPTTASDMSTGPTTASDMSTGPTTASDMSTGPTTAAATSSARGRTHDTSCSLWISVVVCLLWKINESWK